MHSFQICISYYFQSFTPCTKIKTNFGAYQPSMLNVKYVIYDCIFWIDKWHLARILGRSFCFYLVSILRHVISIMNTLKQQCIDMPLDKSKRDDMHKTEVNKTCLTFSGIAVIFVEWSTEVHRNRI